MERLGFLGRLGVIMAGVRERFSSLTVGTALATVAFSSGFISYTHICALTLAEHGNWKTAHLMPLAVDGQIVIGSAYFMDGRNRWQKAAGLLFGVLPGIGESLYANWESGIASGAHSAVWATVPAQAFACSAFLFERWLKNRREAGRAGRSAAELLAAALADAAGLREALAGAQSLAEASLARAEAAVAMVARPAPQAPPARPVFPAPVPWPVAGPTQPLARAHAPAAPPRAAPLKSAPALREAPARRKVGPVPEAVLAMLPAAEAERRQLFLSNAANEVARLTGVSRYWAQHLSRLYKGEEARRAA